MVLAFLKVLSIFKTILTWGFPGSSVVKNLPANAGDSGWIPGSGRSPGRGHGNPLQDSCLENPHGQRSLAGYGPWGHKESDTTETLCFRMSLKRTLVRFHMQGSSSRRDQGRLKEGGEV